MSMTADWDAAFEQALDFHRSGRLDMAAEAYRRLLADQPENEAAPALLNNLGQIHRARGEAAEAIRCYRRAVELAPDFADAHSNLGNALNGAGAADEAVACYRRALAADPGHLLAMYNLATTLMTAGRARGDLEESAALFENIVAVRPEFADAHNNLGLCRIELGQTHAAIRHFEHVLGIQADHADALDNLGRALMDLGDGAGAEQAFRRSLEIRPSGSAFNNLGTLLRKARAFGEARRCFEQALRHEPDHGPALTNLVYICLYLCDWRTAAEAGAKLDRATAQAIARKRRPAESPFLNLVRHPNPALNRAVAEAWSRSATTGVPAAAIRSTRPSSADRRITLGYFSSDFGNHPIGHIMAEILPRHDRGRFRVLAFSHGADDGGPERRQLAAACDAFYDVRALDADAVVDRIRAEDVDILIDLNGYTQGRRLAVAALRPAPVQILHLYVGPVGGGIFDYIVTDPVCVPRDHVAHYGESPIYLPHCFLPGRRVDAGTTGRAAEGLPADAFVLCSFNQAYKFDPETFAAWLRLLRRHPGAVLWLVSMPPETADNLRAEAGAQGVDPNRLIFAGWARRPDHLARLALADLAVDTAIYGGHQTTCDALCAGVPVVVRQGGHFASRLAASLVAAAGVPELAAESLEAYEALAGALMDDPARLRALRARLATDDAPLFDSVAYVRSLEDGYAQAWQRHADGQPPAPIFAQEHRP